MAPPPVKKTPSVVLKLHKPSTAQVSLAAEQKQQASTTYQEAMRRFATHGADPNFQPQYPSGLVHPPATAVDKQGFVSSPLGDLGAPAKTPEPHRKVTVKVHPGGQIEVVHAPHAAAPKAPVSQAPAAGVPAPQFPPGAYGGSYQTDAQGRTDTPGAAKAPVAVPKKRTPAGSAPAAPAAPQLTDAQTVTNLLAQMYGPLITQTQGVFKDRQSGVNDYTKILADLMGSYGQKSGEAYGQAQSAQAAVDAALGAALGGNAATAQTDLAGKLGGLGNADYASKLTGDLGTAYQGGQGVQASQGANTLGSLIAEGAHAKDFGAKQPGLAGLYGLQATKGLSKELKTTLTNLQTQQATQIPTLLQGLQTNRNQQSQLQFEHDLAQKQYGLDVKKTNASLTAQKAQLDNQTATTLSNLYGIDANGTLTLAGRRVATAEAAAKKKQTGLTASQKTGLLTKADKRADDFYYGTPPRYYQGQPVAGSGLPPVEYPQALQRLVAMGLTVAQAKKTLDARYQPGEGGRPMFTDKQQAINSSLFPDPFAGLTTGH